MSILEEQQKYSQTGQDYHDIAMADIKSFFFVSQPWAVPLTLISYLSFVYINMKFFKQRSPLNLKFPMLVYNVIQVLLNMHLSFVVIGFGRIERIKYFSSNIVHYFLEHACHPLDPKANHIWLNASFIARYYFMLKVLDLMDTVFIVLRKKEKQITFLHLYHHTSMVLMTWYAMKFMQAEQFAIVGLCNSIIHMIMYSYYALTITSESMRKYLWWKKCITILQMGQFAFYILYGVALLVLGCPQPPEATGVTLIGSALLFVLFKNFYTAQYNKYDNKSSTQNTLEKQE